VFVAPIPAPGVAASDIGSNHSDDGNIAGGCACIHTCVSAWCALLCVKLNDKVPCACMCACRRFRI
jgi:hypothetical protein